MAESLHSPKLAESLPDKGAYVHKKMKEPGPVCAWRNTEKRIRYFHITKKKKKEKKLRTHQDTAALSVH